jgi:DNA-binding IclR family transcriptional regulator
MTVPLCPLVLSMLEANPRRPDEVARELSGTGFAAATVTLTRLADSGLVRRRERDGRYLVTRRGRA